MHANANNEDVGEHEEPPPRMRVGRKSRVLCRVSPRHFSLRFLTGQSRSLSVVVHPDRAVRGRQCLAGGGEEGGVANRLGAGTQAITALLRLADPESQMPA